MAYVYTQLHICVTIFSNGSIVPLVFKFTELHALTLAACSYALLKTIILECEQLYLWENMILTVPDRN